MADHNAAIDWENVTNMENYNFTKPHFVKPNCEIRLYKMGFSPLNKSDFS
jgi:hypothetical protein